MPQKAHPRNKMAKMSLKMPIKMPVKIQNANFGRHLPIFVTGYLAGTYEGILAAF